MLMLKTYLVMISYLEVICSLSLSPKTKSVRVILLNTYIVDINQGFGGSFSILSIKC